MRQYDEGMRSSLFFARTGALAACAACALAQPPFRTLHLTAFDKSGQAITDLAPGDVQISDDGKPQQVLFLHLNDEKPAPPAGALAPREFSNQAGFRPGATVILFDLLNGTFTDRNFITSTILKSLENVENPGNIFLYILTNNGNLYPVRPIPKDVSGATEQEDWTAQAKSLLDNAIQNVFGLRGVDTLQSMEANREIMTYHALHELGATAMPLPGRKTIVWTSQGFSTQVDLGGHCQSLTVEGVKALCNGNFVDFMPPARRLAMALDAAGVTIDPVDEAEASVHVMAREMFDTLAGVTGGKTFPRGGTPAAVAASMTAARLNYTLGYEPPAKNWNGKFHKVKVTCARKNVQIQAEDGYFADQPADQTVSLVDAAATVSGNMRDIAVAALVSPGGAPDTLHVQVKIGPAGVLLAPKDGHFTGSLALVAVGLTDQGPKQLGKPSALDLNLTQAEYETAQKGLSTTEDVPTPAGVRTVRIVVVDRWTNRVGSVTFPAKM